MVGGRWPHKRSRFLLETDHPDPGHIAGRLLSIALGLWEELETSTHRPGAISRNRANTSDAGAVSDPPASKRAIR